MVDINDAEKRINEMRKLKIKPNNQISQNKSESIVVVDNIVNNQDIDDFLLNKMGSEESTNSNENDQNLAQFNQIYYNGREIQNNNKIESKSFNSSESLSQNQKKYFDEKIKTDDSSENYLNNVFVKPSAQINKNNSGIKSNKIFLSNKRESATKIVIENSNNAFKRTSTQVSDLKINTYKLTDSVTSKILGG